MNTSRDWAAATASGDLERALAYWTDDAIELPPDQPAVVGKTAIRAYVLQAASTPGFSITWAPELAVVSENGDMGYMVERNTVTFDDATGVQFAADETQRWVYKREVTWAKAIRELKPAGFVEVRWRASIHAPLSDSRARSRCQRNVMTLHCKDTRG